MGEKQRRYVELANQFVDYRHLRRAVLEQILDTGFPASSKILRNGEPSVSRAVSQANWYKNEGDNLYQALYGPADGRVRLHSGLILSAAMVESTTLARIPGHTQSHDVAKRVFMAEWLGPHRFASQAIRDLPKASYYAGAGRGRRISGAMVKEMGHTVTSLPNGMAHILWEPLSDNYIYGLYPNYIPAPATYPTNRVLEAVDAIYHDIAVALRNSCPIPLPGPDEIPDTLLVDQAKGRILSLKVRVSGRVAWAGYIAPLDKDTEPAWLLWAEDLHRRAAERRKHGQ